MTASRLQVSVIVPTFNRANLLREAIDSLLSQTRVPDEIIVVDDGSTDDTRSVLDSYSESVIALYQQNAERSHARNTGVDRATGDLIAFLDDDDTLTPNSIESRAKFLEENDRFGAVYGDIQVTDLEGKVQGLYSRLSGISAPSGYIFPSLVQRSSRPIHAFMCRRNCFVKVGGFKPGLSYFEDWHLWLRVALRYDFHYLDEVMGNYRYHPGQSTAAKPRAAIETEIAIREEAFRFPAFAAMTPQQKARAISVHATQYALLGDYAAARQWYLSAIRQSPLMPRLYVLLAFTLAGKRAFTAGSWLKAALRGGTPGA